MLKELLCFMQGPTVIPLQTWTYGDVSVEQVGLGNQCMNRQQSAKRMSGKDAIRRCPVTFFDLRNQLALHELQEFVSATTGRIRLDFGSAWSEIARSIGIAYPDNDQRRHAIVCNQEIDRAAD